MKFRYLILAILGIIVAFAFSLMIYLGVFKPVVFSEGRQGPFKLIYKEHTGSYHKIVSKLQEVESWAKQNNIDCSKSFGMYLDDPEKTEESRLRSYGGCLVTEIPSTLPEDIKSKELPERLYLMAQFEGSPAIGPFKVYPKIQKQLKDNNQTLIDGVLEVYVIHSEKEMTTTYYFPISN